LESAHNLSHACWNRALVRVVGRPVSVTLGGQAGRPAAGKGPLCRLCVGLPPRVVSPVRVGQSGAGRPGGGVGRASGDPFAVLPPAPSVRCEVRAVVPAVGPAWRRGGAAACCGRVAGIARAGQ